MNFKKKFMALSLASAMTLTVCTPTFAATTNFTNVQVNGVQYASKASVIDGKSYIKVADIKTILGADVTVSGDKLSFADGKTADVTTIDGVQYAVIRDIATAEDYMLGWDDTEKTVIIVDTERIDKSEFTIMKKYMQYALDAQPEISKTEGTFNGYVEITEPEITAEATPEAAASTAATTTAATTTAVSTTGNETIKVPFSGTMTGVSSKTVANVDMNLKIDFSQVKELAAAEGTDAASAEQTILDALADSQTKVIFDSEKGVYYIKSSMFDALGVASNTWISIDLNELLSMSGSNMNFSSIMELATKGDFEGYINGVIKSMPVNSVSSYNDIKTAYDTISELVGDKAFKLEDGKYKSNYTVNEDGTEVTIAMTFDTDGDKINGGTIKLHMNSDGVTMDMDMASDKDLKTTMTINMSVADMMKLYMDYKATVAATTESPLTAPPAGETVTTIESLMGGLMAAE